MEEKYKKAIIAGVVCGIILVILALIGNVIVPFVFGDALQRFVSDYSYYSSYGGYYGTTPTIPPEVWAALAIDLVLVVLGALTFVAAGVLAARIAAPFLKVRNDALVAGAIAGAAAEVVHRPFQMIFTFIMGIIKPTSYSYSSYSYGTGSSSAIVNALYSLISSLICCFPIILVCGVILAVAGALAYAALRLKL